MDINRKSFMVTLNTLLISQYSVLSYIMKFIMEYRGLKNQEISTSITIN